MVNVWYSIYCGVRVVWYCVWLQLLGLRPYQAVSGTAIPPSSAKPGCVTRIPCLQLLLTVHIYCNGIYTGTTTLLYKPYCRVIGILCRSAGAQNNIFYCRLK